MAVKNLSSRKKRRYRSSKFSRLPLPIRALIGVALSLSGFLCGAIILSLVIRAFGAEEERPFSELVLYSTIYLMAFGLVGLLMQFIFRGTKRWN
ncbi:hypothetical protein ES703_121127 [subsurface metagenome]